MVTPEPPRAAAGKEDVAAASEAVPKVGLAGVGSRRSGSPGDVGGDNWPWL